MARESKKKRTLAGRLWRLLLVKIPAAFLALTILWVVALKWIPVAVTPLMIQRSIQHIDDKNFHTRKTWVSYGKISPEMARAVIASEDNLLTRTTDSTGNRSTRPSRTTNRKGNG